MISLNKELAYSTFQKSLKSAIANDFSSYDVSDLVKTKYNVVGSNIKNLLAKKIFMKPYSYIIKYRPEVIRSLVKDKFYKYPQGVAMTIRGLKQAIDKGYDVQENTALAISLGEWLLESKSNKSKNLAWGQPFIWYSREIFPENIPRATVSSQVGWAFLDLYSITEDARYLEYVKSIATCFIEEFNYTNYDDGSLCISYTTVDNYHIHNANVLASAMIARIGKITDEEKFLEFARKSSKFTIGHQNEDGSFYYWAPPDKIAFKIDNIHTGFVLDSLNTLRIDLDSSAINNAYHNGLRYYKENLFEGLLPKLDINKTYPIDIQCCGQAIITFMESDSSELQEDARKIAAYTYENMFLKKENHFAYKLYRENGFRDSSYYFRWGDAWMLKALAYLM